MGDILGRAKSLGIEFAEEEKEDLEHLSELQELLHDAEREYEYLGEAGEDTTVHARVINKVREEIRALSEKLR